MRHPHVALDICFEVVSKRLVRLETLIMDAWVEAGVGSKSNKRHVAMFLDAESSSLGFCRESGW